jgi:hypothetical protein
MVSSLISSEWRAVADAEPSSRMQRTPRHTSRPLGELSVWVDRFPERGDCEEEVSFDLCKLSCVLASR